MRKTLLPVIVLFSTITYGQQSATIKKEKTTTGTSIFQQQFNNKSGGNPIWGAGATVGNSEGQFSNNFTQATTYTAGDNITSWTALSLNQSTGATTPGSAFWVRSLTGYSAGAYWNGTTPIPSPSQTDGVAIFDSDFLDNGGVVGAFGTGTAPASHRGELISPRIDLTGYSDSAIAVNFYSLYRNYNINELSVSLSIDDGITWSSPLDYRTLQASETEGEINTVFTSITAGVANLTQIRIKFVFDGNYYFAIIDDVNISVPPKYDLTLGTFQSGSNSLLTSGEQIHISNNRHYPISEVGSHSFQYYGANVANSGYKTIYPSDSANLKLTIQRFIGGTWSSVFEDSTFTDTIVGTGIIPVFDTITDHSWAQIGNYRAVYSVKGLPDNNSSNDSIFHLFSITQTYASKVDIDTNNQPYANRYIASAGGPFSSIEWGSIFNFPTAGTNNLSIDSVTLKYYIAANFTGTSSQTYFLNIYEFIDSNQDNLLNDNSDLIHIGAAPMSLSNLTSNLGTYQTATIGSFVNPSSGGAMNSLADGKQYYISVLMNPSLTGGVATFNPTTDVIQIAASELKNYNMNAISNPISQPSPIRLTDNGGDSWYWTGFGMNVIPSIGLHVSTTCSAINYNQSITSCDNNVLINGNLYNSSQIVIDTLINPHTGCDSIVTTNLTLNNINTTVTTSGINLTANEIGATYQWLDCNSNNSTITGENSQNFTPNSNGSYAVEITKNTCVDTTNCINISTVGIESLSFSGVYIYPNPTNEHINIHLGSLINVNVNIYNVNGQLIYNEPNINSTIHQLELNYNPGIYFIEVISEQQVMRYKVEKK